MTSSKDLSRFVDEHRRTFAGALAEIEGGRKTGHWMWFVFPQVDGLGSSHTARSYAIRSPAEAEAFLLHPILGPNYRTITRAVWKRTVGEGQELRSLLGTPDDLKLLSSLTLFGQVAGRMVRRGDGDVDELEALVAQAAEICDHAAQSGYAPCETTLSFLERNL
ncbi:DUF1810 domain-containing protein [Rhabdothermincola salaria]|uniref:DUF1810 domain-containing protein n=1 Tax=Rhabdothermincola salaria TaxID=2903142 RepID=UPI001E283380|nr:DUF1810 family protein [Rhabdothermincola salaria]MCD9625289.1 DUF1810 domain-containing protein [Rhabdothermincola salaria]